MEFSEQREGRDGDPMPDLRLFGGEIRREWPGESVRCRTVAQRPTEIETVCRTSK